MLIEICQLFSNSSYCNHKLKGYMSFLFIIDELDITIAQNMAICQESEIFVLRDL